MMFTRFEGDGAKCTVVAKRFSANNAFGERGGDIHRRLRTPGSILLANRPASIPKASR
jgi:hypothetical protein